MAVMTQIAAHHDSSLRGRFVAAIQKLQEHRARRAVYSQTLRELNALSGRELEDLGIHRSMITRIAHEAAFGGK